MTIQQLKDKVQAALTTARAGGPVERLDEITDELFGYGPSGVYHAKEVLRHRADPGRLAIELALLLDRLENHPGLFN